MRRIDIGAGRKPRANYDAYIDVYEPRWVKEQPEFGKKFVLTGAEDLSMFGNKEFDFAMCHHVIEHVQDPAMACSEMCRIAKEGILYFPTVELDILIGRPDHRWLVFPDYRRNHLLFIRKRFKSYYGRHQHQLPPGVRPWTGLQQKPFEWKGEFKWTVVW